MDALISLVYTIIDSVCVCLFLDAFASHRWRNHRFLVGVIVQTILMYASIEFSVIALRECVSMKKLKLILFAIVILILLLFIIGGMLELLPQPLFVLSSQTILVILVCGGALIIGLLLKFFDKK